MEPYQIKLAGLLGLAALGLAVTDTAPIVDANGSVATDQPSSTALGPARNRDRPSASHRQYDPSTDDSDKPDFDRLAAKAETGAEMTAGERQEFTRQIARRLEHPDTEYSPEVSSPD